MRHYAKKMLLLQDSTPLKDDSGISERRGHNFGPREVLSLYLKLHIVLILPLILLVPSPIILFSPLRPPTPGRVQRGGRKARWKAGGIF